MLTVSLTHHAYSKRRSFNPQNHQLFNIFYNHSLYMAFNIYACINTVTSEENLCDRLHNACKMVFLKEVAGLIVL